MDDETIRKRIAGRVAADEIKLLLEADLSPQFVDAFLSRLKDTMLPKPAEVTQQPISRLGSYVLEFGIHNGKTLDETPLDYLDWLCSEEEPFLKTLQAYLKHPDLARHRPSG